MTSATECQKAQHMSRQIPQSILSALLSGADHRIAQVSIPLNSPGPKMPSSASCGGCSKLHRHVKIATVMQTHGLRYTGLLRASCLAHRTNEEFLIKARPFSSLVVPFSLSFQGKAPQLHSSPKLDLRMTRNDEGQLQLKGLWSPLERHLHPLAGPQRVCKQIPKKPLLDIRLGSGYRFDF